ncbi:hypothetical protein ACTJJ0_23200 [Chitinophaga sp. 22321]|uniref:PKD-like family protein n=1 Tax=Chitinophaga hostae TaxID=2831022 RepID=A0ABS5J870_9BACT|nr:hypothetical protein [Chitinophaga hostae]MBS0031403.1 hypothetical protein [Chitinophaga hostae]
MKKTFLPLARLCLYAICLLVLPTACKKVDDHSTMVLSQPWLADYYTQLSGSRLAPITWTYPSTLLVDDTAVLIGKLFPYSPGTRIMIGDAEAKIIDTAQFAQNYTTYTPQGKLDAVRFLITKEMGVGNNRPVTITANGITIHGPAINIRRTATGAGRTDTTLWVDEIAQWKPDNMNDYTSKGNYLALQLSNDNGGNIYFSNRLAIQAVNNGHSSTLLKSGDIVHEDKGSDFKIGQIFGSAVTFEGNALFFSAEVTDNPADEKTAYIFRLCKMDLATKTVTTINRTLVARGFAADETGAPFQGSISQLKVVALTLHTDINDNLYYTNAYAPGSSTGNHQGWYQGLCAGTPTYESFNCILLISRLDASGKVHGLMYYDLGYGATGFPVFSGNYLPDPSGKSVYGYFTTTYVRYDMLQYNVEDDDKGALFNTYGDTYIFHSYEDNPLYKKLSGNGFITDPYAPQINPVLQLTDGTMLVSSNSSLASYDLRNKIQFCYAGTEIGLDAPPAEQNKKTGLAKWVDFTGVTLIGQDKTGAVYYCSGISDYDNGITFYKMYPKKK